MKSKGSWNGVLLCLILVWGNPFPVGRMVLPQTATCGTTLQTAI